MKAPTKRATRRLAASIVVVLALAAAQSAQAKLWEGKGSDTLWSTPGNWENSTLPATTDSLAFRRAGAPNKTATLDALYSYNGTIHIGDGSSASSPYIFEATDPSYGLTIKDDVWLGYYEDGWLWIKSGTYIFGVTKDKGLHIGQAKSGSHNFWLKVGDGLSTASLNAKANKTAMFGGSVFIADKATLDFTGKDFEMSNTSSAYFTNTTFTAAYVRIADTTSMTLSNSTFTFTGDFNLSNGTGGNCTFKGVESVLQQTSGNRVFNVGAAQNSTATVEKDGGDWDCYYLRIGKGSGSTGTFTMNGGTFLSRNELSIGYANGSIGTFTLNGGSVTNNGNLYFLGSAPTLNINSGSFTVASDKEVLLGAGVAATINLNGGMLTTKHIKDNGATSASVLLNGGTIQANGTGSSLVDSTVDVKVGANGGTFHTGGHAITVPAAVNAATGVAGDLTVTGGGSATFSAPGNLTGAFAIGENTALHWFDQDGAVADYPISSISIAPGANLYLDADSTGCDTFGAATTNITATSANPATITLVFVSAAPAGTSYTLFDTVDGSEFVVVPLLGALELPHETSVVDGKLVLTITAEDYTWNGTQTNWGDADAWTKGGASATWTPGNNAIFDTAGREAVLAADAAASEVRFTANAAVSGESTLAVSKVDVASGATATISAPIGSAFSKTGAGTLVLGTNCTVQTTLSDGTLALACTNAIEWSNVTLGTDAAKPVTLRFADGATLANAPAQWFIGQMANVTSTVVKAGGDWTIGNMYIADAEGAYTSFRQEGGTLNLTSVMDIGRKSSAAYAHFDIAGGTVSHNDYTHMGANCPAAMTVRSGAKYEMTRAVSYGMIVGGNADAALNAAGGEVFIDGPVNLAYYGANGPNGVVNVSSGGVISCDGFKVNSSSAGGSGLLSMDGGMIRANKDNAAFVPNKDNMTVLVRANGGTIDANSKAITILRPILEDSESTGGGMTFKGGGIVTLASGNTYTGKTTVEVGTTVHVAAPGEIGGGLAVTVPETAPADGVYTLVTIDGSGTFGESVLTGVVAPDNATLRLRGDGKSVICIVGDPGFVWVGGASGSLSEASNWANNAVPGVGANCIIGNAAAANLTNPTGSDFAPDTITFPADTALVTISGEGTLSGLTSIVNNSSQHHVIACPVDASAATPTLPLADGNYLVFSGGIALNSMPSVASMRLAGVWNLTGDWTEPPTGTSIMSGSTVTVSGVLDDGYNIVVNANATLQVARARANLGADSKNRFLYKNDGTFIVTGEMQDKILHASGSYSLAGFFANGNNNAVTRANGLVHAGSTKNNHIFRLSNSANSATNTIVLGLGGLSFRDNLVRNTSCYPYFQIDSGKSAVLASSADWSLGANPVSGKDLCLELAGFVTIDTSDYDDRTVPHTITAIGRIGNHGKVTVTGCGTMAFEHSSDFGGGLDVKDTATVSFNSGCGLGRCGANVDVGATLEVAQSGTVALSGDLTLASGAALAFNFTERATAPTLSVSGAVTANGAVVVKISSDNDVRPAYGNDGKYVLTSGGKFANVTVSLDASAPNWVKGVSVENDEIVLYVKPIGTIFLIM